ncbi:cardiolipin synthase (CMP-forming) [Planctomycetaceae bacterium]|nr:cardiolipin synthase (CMP-forming) [Planctomycetaceae bacterium]
MNDAPTAKSFWTLANFFTFLRFLLAPVVGAMLLTRQEWGLWAGGWTAGFAMITDYLDGYFARKHGGVSDLGKIFDPLADAVFFLVVIVCLGLAGYIPLWLSIPFLAREFAQHVYLRPTAALFGVVLAANMWGKLKTVIQCVVLVAICISEEIALYWPWFAGYHRWLNLGMFGLAAFVSVASIVPYVKAVLAAQRAPSPREA